MQKRTPLKAIREKCMDCSGGAFKEVRLCTIPRCPLFPYRMGKRPTYEGETLVEGKKAYPPSSDTTKKNK
jgi:hypothetical protein